MVDDVPLIITTTSRRQFIKKYTQAKLEDPMRYDSVINAERLIFEDAASIAVYAAHFKDRPELGEQGIAPRFK